jgi:Inorganic pyrophosphatase
MGINFFLIVSISISVLAFVFAYMLFLWVKKQPSDNVRIAEVGSYIRKGASTFLNKEYSVLAKFAGVVLPDLSITV